MILEQPILSLAECVGQDGNVLQSEALRLLPIVLLSEVAGETDRIAVEREVITDSHAGSYEGLSRGHQALVLNTFQMYRTCSLVISPRRCC